MNDSDNTDVKALASKFMKGRKLKPKTDKGYEALFAFYYGYYRGDLPPYVVICMSCGRQDELC